MTQTLDLPVAVFNKPRTSEATVVIRDGKIDRFRFVADDADGFVRFCKVGGPKGPSFTP